MIKTIKDDLMAMTGQALAGLLSRADVPGEGYNPTALADKAVTVAMKAIERVDSVAAAMLRGE